MWIDEDPITRPAYRDAFRRLGALGLAGRAWSASVGRLLDVRILLECELATTRPLFEPVPGFSFAAVTIERDPGSAEAAARLLRVRLSERRSHRLFVARNTGGQVVGCTWNEPAKDGRARHRGVGVAAGCRGRGLAPALLAFQATELGREGVTAVLLRTGVGNRAARRMLHKARARLVSIQALFLVAGRGVGPCDVTGRLEAFLRRSWESERHEVEILEPVADPIAAVAPATGCR
jgi:ribosomal protein S18 acetylase RimI-like enzyme